MHSMNIYDQHLHSNHSFDSSADPAEVCAAAIERGLAGITFTEHFDTHPTEWDQCQFDYAAIAAEHARLRERFGQRLTIGTGIEVCYQPARMDFILNYLAHRYFDLVILSVHWTPHGPIHEKKSWQGLSAQQGTRQYLETVLDAVRYCAQLKKNNASPFHVLGHLDFVKRYTHRWWGQDHIEDFALEDYYGPVVRYQRFLADQERLIHPAQPWSQIGLVYPRRAELEREVECMEPLKRLGRVMEDAHVPFDLLLDEQLLDGIDAYEGLILPDV